jgi:hypothetical protein
MSPSKAERSTYAATRTNPAKFPKPSPTGANLGSVLNAPVGGNAPTTGIGARRPLDRARVGPSRNAHPHTASDPSNYLG